MSNPGDADDTPLTSVRQMAEYLAAGCKPPKRFRIGTEHEKFAFNLKDLRTLPYDGPAGIRTMLEGLTRFGWVPVLDGSPSPVTVMARTPLTVAVLDLTPRGGLGSPARHIRNIVIAKLRHYSSSFARTSIADRVASLEQQAEFARYRNAVGSIVITALALLSFYTLALSFLPRFENDLAINFVLSPIIIVFFASFFFPVIRRSGLPAAFFGFCPDNWRAALPFAAFASLAFLAIGVFLKWILIETMPQLHGLSLVGFADVRVGNKDEANTPWYWAALSLYFLLTPVQEFVARCGIQAPLYAFLQGS